MINTNSNVGRYRFPNCKAGRYRFPIVMLVDTGFLIVELVDIGRDVACPETLGGGAQSNFPT